MMRPLAPLLLLVPLAAGCPKREPPAEPPKPAVAPAPAAPGFRADIAPTLELHCALPRCHGTPQTESVALDLRKASAWKELVNHPSEARKGAVRVKPGDSAQSFLVDKLTGSLQHGEGKAMPIDATTGAPMRPSPLAEWTETKLMRWIDAGALDN